MRRPASLPASLGLATVLALLFTPVAPESEASGPVPILRDETRVVVDGVEETWRLEWKQPPVADCREEIELASCPCNGYEYGEQGHLDLVRIHPGAPTERFALDTIFDGGMARLSRWNVDPAKRGRIDVATLADTPPSHVLALGDYDHDGRATEFVLPVKYFACGHTPRVAVGISRTNPHLHALTAAEEPDAALDLEHASSWEALRTRGAVSETQLSCGDLRLRREALGERARS